MDSGAFSVWTRGAEINLEDYITFCKQHPECSYYVSLDVIPGVYADKRSLRSREALNEGCKRGWFNYKRMIQELPKDKVIPVYHQNDDLKWLDKYLNYGVKYIGISPANDNGTPQKLAWMRELKHILFDGAGNPVVKTHGFAVTSYSMMKYWHWHSVDSATWQRAASFGEIFIPRLTKGEYDYSKSPVRIGITPRCQLIQRMHLHIDNMPPVLVDQIKAYIDSCGQVIGKFKIINVEGKGYKLKKGESWLRKNKTIMRTVVEGLSTSRDARALLNARFMMSANKVLPIEHIYLAGFLHEEQVEQRFKNRLISYAFLNKTKKLAQYFEWVNNWTRKVQS